MKKVLIALDYNPTAQKVAEHGFELATAMKAEIILLHVITYYKINIIYKLTSTSCDSPLSSALID